MAQQHGIQELSLKEVQEVEDLLFSVEFDRINRPGRFRSDFLCKIHFSALPRHRGVAIVVIPLLEVCQNTADQGFDGASRPRSEVDYEARALQRDALDRPATRSAQVLPTLMERK